MKCFVIKYDLIFLAVVFLAACTKVTQTQSTSGGSDTQAVKVDTTVKTKPTVVDSTGWFSSKSLYIKVVDASGIKPLSNVTVALTKCMLDTTANSISPGTCSLAGTWQTDANGTIFIDSSANLAIPGRGLLFTRSKENYWTDSSSFLFVQPGFNKVDTITFTLYAVSWLRVHLQDSIPADSGQLQMYFTPNWVPGPGMIQPFQPSPPASNSNIYINTDPISLVGYQDHLKFFPPGVDATFLIKTTGSTTNQIFIERYISYYDKPGLYTGTQVVNDFDTLDWEIKLQ